MSLMSLTRYRRMFMLMGGGIFAFGALVKLHSMRNPGPSGGSAPISMPAPNPAEIWSAECASYACRDFDLEMGTCQRMCERSLVRGVPPRKAADLASMCIDKCKNDDSDTPDCKSECFVLSSTVTASRRR